MDTPALPAEVLKTALERFDLEVVAELGGFDHFVYECSRGPVRYVLKLSASPRRTKEEVEGRLDFALFLADNGVAVARPVPSIHGRLVEVIDAAPSPVLATVSEKARGTVLPDEDDIPLPAQALDRLLVEWGKLAGRIHRLAKGYRPTSPQLRHLQWYEEHEVWDVEKHLPVDQAVVKERVHALFQRFRSLSTGADSYGLIHYDLHHGNFSIDEDGQLTLFDFDSCMVSWFAMDISCALYTALPYPPSRVADRSAFAPRFLQHFMTGYLSENWLDPAWMAHLPDFLKYEEIAAYVLYHQLWDIGNLTAKRAQLLARYRHAIENDVPVVDFDFVRWMERFLGG